MMVIEDWCTTKEIPDDGLDIGFPEAVLCDVRCAMGEGRRVRGWVQ